MPVRFNVKTAGGIGAETIYGVGAARGTMRRVYHIARQHIGPVNLPGLSVLNAPGILGVLNLLQVCDTGAALAGPAAGRNVRHGYRTHKADHGHDDHQLNQIKTTIAFHISAALFLLLLDPSADEGVANRRRTSKRGIRRSSVLPCTKPRAADERNAET